MDVGIAVEHLIGWVLGRVEVEETIMVEDVGGMKKCLVRGDFLDFWMMNVEVDRGTLKLATRDACVRTWQQSRLQ